MENCLITKLKGTVDNPALPILGGFKLSIPELEDYYFMLAVKSTSDVTIKALGNGKFASSIADITEDPKTEASTSSTTLYMPASGFNLLITDVKYLTEFTFELRISSGRPPADAPKTKIIDLADLKGLSLHKLDLLAVAYGDLANIKDLPMDGSSFLYLVSNNDFDNPDVSNIPKETKQIYIQLSNISGSFEDIPEHKFTTFQNNAMVTGTVEGIVSDRVDNEYYANFTLAGNNGGVPFNGTKLSSGSNVVSYTSASVIYVTNGNKVLTMGYTDAQIAENTAAGGIWEGKTVTKVD